MAEACQVVLKGLSVGFDIPGGLRVEALRDIDLTLRPGSFTCILGPTGCGKTTLLRAIAGLEAPSAGTISHSCEAGSPRTGFVFQQHALFPWMTVLSNAEFGLKAAGIPRGERMRRARELLGLVGLKGFEHAWPYQLSGGMQQRVALVRSLAADPELLLLDEPLSSLDAGTRFELEDLVLDLWRICGTTMLFVTHSVEEAVYLADRVIVLGNRPGRIVFETLLETERPRDRLSRSFDEKMLQIRRVIENLVIRGEPGDGTPGSTAGCDPAILA